MCVLFCKIFGHKFFFTSFVPNGVLERGISGFWFEQGTTYRHETTYCTRCGAERADIMEKTRTPHNKPSTPAVEAGMQS